MFIPHYRNPVWLTGPSGNNAFDLDKRSETNPEPQLRVAPLLSFENVTAALQQLHVGRDIMFEVFDDDRVKSFAGLENFLLFPNPISDPVEKTTPVFVFDNHNHAFYFWHITQKTLSLTRPLTLIHIDQHKDSRVPAELLSPQDAEIPDKLYTYTNEILNVGNFIPPAVKTGLIDRVINIDSSTTLETMTAHSPRTHSDQTPYILDIDLDFFAPELDYIDHQKKIDLIKKLLPHAAITTIATSPFFMDQQKAIALIRDIFSN